MTYKVYIESCNGWPIGDWGVSAWQGFREMGVECILFEDIEEVPKSKLNIVVACIETTHKYLGKLGISIPRPLNIPWELTPYAKRLVWTDTVKNVKSRTVTWPMFVKPHEVAKQFVPGIISSRKDADFYLGQLDESTEVLCQTTRKFLSEYRCYVLDGKLQGVYWYSGDFYHYPDIKRVETMIKGFTEAPIGYTIDVGLVEEKVISPRTVLIECNDGYALGNYGLAPDKYAKLLARRWRELTMVGPGKDTKEPEFAG